jgi:transposase
MARLRWHLHELDPSWEPAPRSLDRPKTWATIEARLDGVEGLVARLARNLIGRCRELTVEINALHTEITAMVTPLAPALLAVCGCGSLTAAKIVAETAGVDRFHSAAAYARHNGTAPLPVWSSNQPRHRLSRTGNRQLNAALYRIALTQARCHPGARTLLERRRNQGDGTREAFRVLRRRLSDVVYRALQTDHQAALCPAA